MPHSAMTHVHRGHTEKTVVNVGGGLFILRPLMGAKGTGGASVYVQCTVTFSNNFSEDAKII